MKKETRGRKPHPDRPYKKIPQRQLGRVEEKLWDELRSAAKAKGVTFTEWALKHLIDALRREQK